MLSSLPATLEPPLPSARILGSKSSRGRGVLKKDEIFPGIFTDSICFYCRIGATAGEINSAGI
jgi:hypothetical protein